MPAKSPLLVDGFVSIMDSIVVDLTMGVSMRVDMLDSITDSMVVDWRRGVLMLDLVDMEGMDMGRRGNEQAIKAMLSDVYWQCLPVRTPF